MKKENKNGNAVMEQAIRGFLRDVAVLTKGTINAMLVTELEACDEEKRTLTLRAVPELWMSNPMRALHGGISASYMDFAMGVLCRYFAGKMTPTIQMSTEYLRAIPLGKDILITAKITKPGSAIFFTEASIVLAGQEDRPLATASATYFAGGEGA